VTRFEQFIKHRQYLLNVSANTIRWYRHAFKWLPPENPTHEDLNATVLRMRESGLRPTGCNAAARAINAYKRLSSLVKWPDGQMGRRLSSSPDNRLEAASALRNCDGGPHCADRSGAEIRAVRLRGLFPVTGSPFLRTDWAL